MATFGFCARLLRVQKTEQVPIRRPSGQHLRL
jgi:hypothetical protein